MTTPTKCQFCDKRGLPLLLVRDAVAPAGGIAPVAPDLPIELNATAAHYTKRLLRSGYVNVFDEARRRWENYFVTSEGYYFKTLQTPGVIPVVPSKPFECPDEGHRAVASCITISDPLNATKVWIGFSDVLWTEAIRKANEKVAYRKQHMVEIDVAAVLNGTHLPHRPIEQLDAVVAEYAIPIGRQKGYLDWSPFGFFSCYGRADRLKQECENMRPGKALIVTVSDPVGITQELAFLMKRNVDMFIESNPENRKKFAASIAIEHIKAAIEKRAETIEIVAAEHVGNQLNENPVVHWLPDSVRSKNEKMYEISPSQLGGVAQKEWKKYDKKYNEKERQLWIKPFNEMFSKFDKKFIAPLALNHVSWFKSTDLSNHFKCNYDNDNVEAGAVYTSVITQCITATQDKQACSALYIEWLNGDISDHKNLLLRAMILNQEVTAGAIKKASEISRDLRQIPWDNIFKVSSEATKNISQTAQQVGVKLIAQFAGSIGGMFNKIMDGSSGFRAAVMAMGLISGQPIVICELVGSKKAFRKLLVRQLLKASGESISKSEMNKAVNIELKNEQIRGADIEGTTRKRWVMVADKEMIARMPSGLTPQQRADWLAKSIKTVEALEELNLHRWRTVINREFRLGIVTGILQVVSLTKLVEDDQKSLKDERIDSMGRRLSGVASIALTTAEIIGNAFSGQAALGMRFGQGFASRHSGKLINAGRVGGLCVGLIMAVLDTYKGIKELNEGSDGLIVVSYFGSAFIGTWLSVAIFMTASWPIIGLLVLLAIGIGILIENIKDNPIQDWLERCPWGRLEEQRYKDFHVQQEELKKALS